MGAVVMDRIILTYDQSNLCAVLTIFDHTTGQSQLGYIPGDQPLSIWQKYETV